MNTRRKLLAAGASAALVAAGVVGGALPASAAAQYATLHITPSWEHPGYYDVVVSGHINASYGTIGMRLIGDDPVFNDDLGVSRTGQVYGGDFALYALVWHGTLNEDWEGQDEIFAKVSGPGFSTSTANVNGYF